MPKAQPGKRPTPKKKATKKQATKKQATKKVAPKKAAPKKPAKSKGSQPAAAELPILEFPKLADWRRWLQHNHASSRGVWIKLAKKKSGLVSIDHKQAVEGALCYGWIDGQGLSHDDSQFMVKFTPRRSRSVWSKINRTKALELIERGEMAPAGLREVERAQQDGRWEAAYDSPRTATVPDDLAAGLAANPSAKAFFAQLSSANRYAILWRLHNAKKAETRARRLAQFLGMLERGETLH